MVGFRDVLEGGKSILSLGIVGTNPFAGLAKRPSGAKELDAAFGKALAKRVGHKAQDALALKASKAAAVAKTTPIAAPTTRDTMAEQRQRERTQFPITTMPVKIPPDLVQARMTSQAA